MNRNAHFTVYIELTNMTKDPLYINGRCVPTYKVSGVKQSKCKAELIVMGWISPALPENVSGRLIDSMTGGAESSPLHHLKLKPSNHNPGTNEKAIKCKN